MTSPFKQNEAPVHGGRIVRPGDSVEILPVSKRGRHGEVGEFLAQEAFDFLRNWLGEGPFIVSSIGRWPCGRWMLYLKGTKGDEPGAHASDFM